MSHTIKMFLSPKIHFLERYVLLSKIVGHKITMNSKWFLYMVLSSLTLSGPGGLRGLDGQTHSYQSETSYPMMPKLGDF